MTRTTIRMDEHLLAQAKQLAARTGRTLTSIIEEALRDKLYARTPIPRKARTPAPRKPIRPLPVFHGDGLQPGVDLEHSASLFRP